jgi:putative Mn2+ efflux pump MntP
MLVRTLAFVAPLGFDTFAVAVALGLRGMAPWGPAVVFAVFETTMPVAGILIG